MANKKRVDQLTEILKDLVNVAGAHEQTSIIPNREVVDATPAGLANFVIVEDEGGFHIPAVKVPGVSYSNGDMVNLLKIKGTEAIAFQQGSGSGSSGVPVHDHSDNTEGGVDLHAIEELEFDDATTLTIDAAGAITRTQVYHAVDTNGGAATDNLDTINGGVEGDLLIIHAANDARTVVVRHNQDNIWLSGADDINLDDAEDHLALVYDGSYWCDIGWSAGAGGWPFTGHILTVDTADADADYASFEAALAAPPDAGDTIQLSSEDHALTANRTVPASVRVSGLDRGPGITGNYALSLLSNAELHGIRRVRAGAHNFANAVTNSGASTGMILRDAYIETSGGIVTTYGVWVATAGATMYIYGGHIKAGAGTASYALKVAAGATVYLFGPILEGVTGEIDNAGTVHGWWYDTFGNFRSADSAFTDIGNTNLTEKFGNVYLGLSKDIYPDHDVYGLWSRQVNFGITPDEHWHQNADDLVWTGWAAYVGYVTPGTITHTKSQKRIQHNAATRAFYYRAASTGADIVLRQGVSVLPTAAGTVHAGVMIDDGVDAADGLGANNYYRVMVESTAATTNWNVRREYRVGGGGAAAAVTAFSLQPGDFYCPVIVAHMNPNWANWWAGMYYRRTNAAEALIQFDNPPFTWTPARVGLYYYISGVNVAYGIWDMYDEATA